MENSHRRVFLKFFKKNFVWLFKVALDGLHIIENKSFGVLPRIKECILWQEKLSVST